jgi:uncharacterized protein
MPQNNHFLIISQSARALAESAAGSGFNVHVIDQFGDQDTSSVALSCRVINSNKFGLVLDQLRSALKDFQNEPLTGVIVGSGLEHAPDMLDWINLRWPLFGNSGEVVRRCKQPELFFAVMKQLGIPYPETSFTIKPVTDGWLLKQAGGNGGHHVAVIEGKLNKLPYGCYLQRKLTGRNLSVVLLCDGKQSQIIGVNETWTVNPVKHDYRYAGAVTLKNINTGLQRELERICMLLVQNLHLRGLCGIDLIEDQQGQCHVLEVNPRPTATAELYQDNINLFQAHIRACMENLPARYEMTPEYHAHRIIYAAENLEIPELSWPFWVKDKPCTGSVINSGMPVCSIHVRARNLASVKHLLDSKVKEIIDIMGLQKQAA